MAKDPAINWYFDNWGGGTKTMSRFLKGCYMDLLDAQFHSGHLSLDEIKHVLGADFSAWQSLQKKFTQDVHGNYFNERLDHEILKRKENSEKQSEKVKKRWEKYHGTYNGNTTVLPNNETEIEIETEIESGKGVAGEKPKRMHFSPPTLEQVKAYIAEKNYSTVNPDSFFNFYASKNWFVGKNKMQDWHKAIAGWDARNRENFNQHGTKSVTKSTSASDQLNAVYAEIKQAVANS